MDRTPGTRLTQAARPLSTSARAIPAPVSRSGAVIRAMRTSGSEESIRVQKSPMLRQCEAIRHAGDVVSDRASFALLAEPRHHLLRQPSGIPAIGLEELAHDRLGLPAGLEHVWVRV